MGGDGTDASPAPSDNPDWLIVESDLMGLKADDLRIQIKRRGVVPRGKKADLQNMLKEIVGKKMPIVEGGPDRNSEALGGFPVGAKWKMLDPIVNIVEDPINKFEFHAPTRQENGSPTTAKQNYEEKFDRPVFEGRDKKGEV